MSAIITIEELHKKYTLKHNVNSGYKSLRDEWTSGAKNIINRFKGKRNHEQKDEEFWALNGISLEIKQGERLGIIGRNGAGKSTLLKVISRIVEPTKGRVILRGRVSSLLEVGTGFHPELSGRENIFLNGAILGMSRVEIARKFDEIVDFAEVEKFLDTPVKHYSSGMYVRLAFSVASSLEPEVLIIDEVLAVGDAKFQKKCLGKLDDVGKSGRTVIFVSHSMPTVASLCSRAILLDAGKIVKDGPVSEAIMHYHTNGISMPSDLDFSTQRIGDSKVRLLKGQIKNGKGDIALEVSLDEKVSVEMTFEVLHASSFPFIPNFYFYTTEGVCAFVAVSNDTQISEKAQYIVSCDVPANLLNEGTYFVALSVSSFGSGVKVHFFERDALSFLVVDSLIDTTTRGDWSGVMPGVVRPKLSWKTVKV
jgi:lipopolysaccharide transport system ATP-binding protein